MLHCATLAQTSHTSPGAVMRYMSKLKAEQNVANVVFLLNKNLFLNSSFLIKQKDYKKQLLWEFKLAVDINFFPLLFRFGLIDSKILFREHFSQQWYFLTKIVLTYCERKLFCDREKLLKFEAESREFSKFLRSLEQFIQTVKGQNNFW